MFIILWRSILLQRSINRDGSLGRGSATRYRFIHIMLTRCRCVDSSRTQQFSNVENTGKTSRLEDLKNPGSADRIFQRVVRRVVVAWDKVALIMRECRIIYIFYAELFSFRGMILKKKGPEKSLRQRCPHNLP